MSKKFVSNYGEDSIGKYFKEVRKTELLTPEEETALAIRIQKGDDEATEELVMANLKFVISIAKEYQNQGLSLGDLISEGNYGLIRAAERFDASRGFRFISYAVWWIKQSIIQSLNDNSRMIRLPANVINKLAKIRREIEKFEKEFEREPEVGEILNPNDDEDELKIILTPKVNSLNAPINEEGGELYELLEDKTTVEDDSPYVIDERLKDELNNTLEILDERERDIIECYFGLNSGTVYHTLEAIGDRYGLTKERIRQIKEKAIRKLRHNSHNLFDVMNEE